MKYAKALVTLVISFLGALVTALGTGNNASFGSIDLKHWLIAMATVVGSTGMVALVENIPGVAGTVAKAIVAFLSAGIGSLIIALNDNHISQAEGLVALIAAISATGLVYQVPNVIRVARPAQTPVTRR
jgi:hypothetical protein